MKTGVWFLIVVALCSSIVGAADTRQQVLSLWDRALDQLHAKDNDGALATAREAIRLAPASAEAWWLAGFVRQSREEYGEAVPLFEKAARLAPTMARPWIDLAWNYIRMEQWDRAEAAARQAVRLGPEIPVAWRDLATAQWNSGKLPQAAESFRMALRLDPYNGRLRAFYAGVLSEMGRDDESHKQYQRGLADLNNATGDVYYTLMWSLQNINDLPGSIIAAQKAIELSNDNAIRAESWNAIAYAHLYAGDVAAGKTAIAEAMKLEPDSPYFLDSAANLALLAGDLGEAERLLSQASALPRAEGYVIPTLALLWARQGKRAEALAQGAKVEREIAESGGVVDDYYLVGQAYAELGENDGARRLFTAGARKFPRHPWGLKMKQWLEANP